MDQRKLYKTIETIASKEFKSVTKMLKEVLKEIVKREEIDVNGGRVWQLREEKNSYDLLSQTGMIEKLPDNFSIQIENYPVFETIAQQRTMLADETHEELRSKGILRFSAAGVGDKIKINKNAYYQFLIALSGNKIDENFEVSLSIIATALTSQIKQLRLSRKSSRLFESIDKGRELQRSILPEHEYDFGRYQLFGVTDPAEIVGGDFFDYLEIGEDKERLAVTVCDAASKGVSAAAESMYISGALRMASSFEIKINPLMKRLNRLVNKIFADDKFASLFYCELSVDKSGLVLYSNAGHNAPLFLKSRTDHIMFLNSTGPVLGPTPNAKYSVENINFSKDDLLLIYSDGIVECSNKKQEQFGEENLKKLLKSLKRLTPKEIAYSILEKVNKFSANGHYNDDKTIVVVKKVK